MPAPTLRTLTSFATLATFDAGLLLDLLQPHRGYLARHGYDLPSDRKDLNLFALVATLVPDDPAFPTDLADALATIVETGTERNLTALDAALRRVAADEHLRLRASPPGSLVDLATRLWMIRPDLLKRIHAEAAIPAMKRCDSWRSANGEIPRWEFPADPEPLLAAWAAELDQHLTEHHLGAGTRIYACPSGEVMYLLIRHGAVMQRVATHQVDGSLASLVYRPAVTDVVRYDPATGELDIHAQKPTQWWSTAIRSSFSRRFFGKEQLFTNACCYSLAPIINQGEAAIDCSSNPLITSVRLTELEVTASDAEDGTIIFRAANVFSFLRARRISVTDLPEPTMMKLAIVLADGSARTVVIRTPNVAVYQRQGDNDVIGDFLSERGFISTEQDHALNQVA